MLSIFIQTWIAQELIRRLVSFLASVNWTPMIYVSASSLHSVGRKGEGWGSKGVRRASGEWHQWAGKEAGTVGRVSPPTANLTIYTRTSVLCASRGVPATRPQLRDRVVVLVLGNPPSPISNYGDANSKSYTPTHIYKTRDQSLQPLRYYKQIINISNSTPIHVSKSPKTYIYV